ncbi:MAG: hypothetical protein JXJ18_11345 [Rhodobacteraceae bacterium]|nr:hypothetical protein [Paracoccaceae bacterium]
MDYATYQGIRTQEGCLVTVDGQALPLRLDLASHSPTGFEWGYRGSGPAQLALAILAHHCGHDERRALDHYQRFKEEAIAPLCVDRWTISGELVEMYLEKLEAEAALED